VIRDQPRRVSIDEVPNLHVVADVALRNGRPTVLEMTITPAGEFYLNDWGISWKAIRLLTERAIVGEWVVEHLAERMGNPPGEMESA